MADVSYELFGIKDTNTEGLKKSVKNKNTFHGYY